MASVSEWWKLPDGTLVRDGDGELHLVQVVTSKLPSQPTRVYLLHWSDEYAPCMEEGCATPHITDWAPTEPLTVVKCVDEVKE